MAQERTPRPSCGPKEKPLDIVVAQETSLRSCCVMCNDVDGEKDLKYTWTPGNAQRWSSMSGCSACRQNHAQRDRQTDRQADRQAGRQALSLHEAPSLWRCGQIVKGWSDQSVSPTKDARMTEHTANIQKQQAQSWELLFSPLDICIRSIGKRQLALQQVQVC